VRLFEIEKDDSTVYFSFVNSNPPTFGYKRALDTLRGLSEDSDTIVFINPVQDNKLYPLDFKDSLKYNKRIFPNITFSNEANIQNPIQALKKLSKTYNKIYFVTRDKNIKEYKRMYTYAENWGVSSFEIIGMGDSKRPLPTGVSKEAALLAVEENDFESFKKTIPSSNTQLVSNLFIELRKKMIDIENRETDNKTDVEESIFHTIKSLASYNSGFLNESTSKDALSNKVIFLEKWFNSLSNLKIVLNPNASSAVQLGEDLQDGNLALILKSDVNDIDTFMDLNEDKVKKAIGVYIKETTTSANIATNNSLFGDIVKRNIDYDEIDNMTYEKGTPKYLQALNHVINKYGYMDDKAAQKIKELLTRW